MVKCSAYRCDSASYHKTPGLTFHRFPKDVCVRNAWIENTKLQDWQPTRSSVLCSKHFENHLIDPSAFRTTLRRGAIPTLFNELPVAPYEKENIINPPQKTLPRKRTADMSNVSVLKEIQNKIKPVVSTSNTTKTTLIEKENVINPPHKTLPRKRTADMANVSVLKTNTTKTTLIEKENVINPPHKTLPRKRTADMANVSVLKEIQNKIKPVVSTSNTTETALIIQDEENVPGPSNYNIVIPSKPPVPVSTGCQEVQILKRKIILKNKKIKALLQQRRRLKKKVSQFSDIITELKNKLSQDDIHILKNIPGNNKDFLVRYIKKGKCSALEKSYSPQLRSFALQLHFYSPRAYNFVRKTFNTILPHPGTITRWYKKINAEPGFTSESFDTLEKLSKSSEHPIYVNLCIDEMAIRKGLVWDSSLNKYKGYVDTGTETSDDSLPLATQALVMLVTAINASWKLPIGFFFIMSMTGEQRATFVKIAIEMLYNVNIIVCGLTFDGAASNISMATSLGCVFNLKSLKPYFILKNTRINVFYDPCHMIKLIRNTLGDYEILVDKDGSKIKFDYLLLLHEIQQKKGLYLANKIRQAHIYYSKQKMKVRLATQLLSRSVADALLYCKDVLKLDKFCDCSATVKFIIMINDAFDILNSRCMYVPGYKKALCAANIQKCMTFSKECEEYLSNLKMYDGNLIVQSARKTGFMGFIICLHSAINMFNDLIITEKLRFLPLYKVSQDHLEMFFGLMRARGGFNDNPNVTQFRTAYKKNITRSQLKLHTEGKLVDLPILTVSSTTDAIQIVNNSTPTFEKNIMEIHDIDEDLIDFFLDDVINTPLDEYTGEITIYIAGFIARKIHKKINCSLCQMLMIGEKENILFSLIKLKDRGGLTYPSQALIKVIQICEKCFKIYKSNEFNSLMKFVADYVDHSIFDSNDPEHDRNHVHLLIKIIVKFYIDLRCKHECKETNWSQRNHLKKIVLFQNK